MKKIKTNKQTILLDLLFTFITVVIGVAWVQLIEGRGGGGGRNSGI